MSLAKKSNVNHSLSIHKRSQQQVHIFSITAPYKMAGDDYLCLWYWFFNVLNMTICENSHWRFWRSQCIWWLPSTQGDCQYPASMRRCHNSLKNSVHAGNKNNCKNVPWNYLWSTQVTLYNFILLTIFLSLMFIAGLTRQCRMVRIFWKQYLYIL